MFIFQSFTGLVEESRRCKGGKKSKQRLAAAFFLAADGSKISEPVVIWKSKSPRCFKNIQDKARLSMVHYFSNEKAWVRTEIMEDVLRLLDRKVQLECRKIILFLDNAPCHPETLQNNLKNIKLIVLPKCTTSRLQPLDVGIITAFKCKYRKRLLKYVIPRIDEGKNASEIIQDVNIAKAIHWLQVAWGDVSTETIINCFQKCGFGQESVNSITNDNEIDDEFESLLTQLREDDEITVEDFVTFDDNLTTSTSQINTDLIDWRQETREEAIKEVVPDTSSANQAVNVVSDDDEDDQEEKTPRHHTTSESLQHIDDLLHFSMMENDATLMGLIAEVTEKVQNIELPGLKQSNIERFF